jgi:hypothetical protein
VSDKETAVTIHTPRIASAITSIESEPLIWSGILADSIPYHPHITVEVTPLKLNKAIADML